MFSRPLTQTWPWWGTVGDCCGLSLRLGRYPYTPFSVWYQQATPGRTTLDGSLPADCFTKSSADMFPRLNSGNSDTAEAPIKPPYCLRDTLWEGAPQCNPIGGLSTTLCTAVKYAHTCAMSYIVSPISRLWRNRLILGVIFNVELARSSNRCYRVT